MHCPSCGNLLQKLSVTTNGGGKFDVEHCGRCGGSWFDPYEINRIPYHEVVRIARLTVLPNIVPQELSAHKCPRCHKDLQQSHYESTPKGVRMLRCPKCGGIWATQRALAEFKKHQEDTIKEYKTSGIAFPSLSVVFVPALFVLLLLVVTFTTVSTLQESKEGRTKAQENISGLAIMPVSPTTVNIFFQTKSAVKSQMTFGTDLFSMENKIISAELSTKHFITLIHLKPSTIYSFKIILEDDKGRTYTTTENSFITR